MDNYRDTYQALLEALIRKGCTLGKPKLYDTSTRNASFREAAEKLDIEDAWALLEIRDPSLIGVNPYAEGLTEDQMHRILVECKNNIWYYLREICRIQIPENALPFLRTLMNTDIASEYPARAMAVENAKCDYAMAGGDNLISW